MFQRLLCESANTQNERRKGEKGKHAKRQKGLVKSTSSFSMPGWLRQGRVGIALAVAAAFVIAFMGDRGDDSAYAPKNMGVNGTDDETFKEKVLRFYKEHNPSKLGIAHAGHGKGAGDI